MTPHQRLVLQIAHDLQTHLYKSRTKSLGIPLLPEREWHRCRALLGRLEICHARGWQVAARSVRAELALAAVVFSARLTGLKADIDDCTLPRPLPSLGELYREILALFEEFENVKYCPKTKTLTVTTEPIELEEVYLGRFQIRLSLPDLGAYQVVAVDPHPASSNDSVTHPHVQNDHLCEGDGQLPIAGALEQGRLTDFFRIVVQILSHYNADSAYVALESWDGTSCSDCGTTAPPDDCYACARCGTDLCSYCRTVCKGCDSTCCSECQQKCCGCDFRFCRTCLTNCVTCAEPFCAVCLTQGKCRECHAHPPCETNADSTENAISGQETSEHNAGAGDPLEPGDPLPAVHADRLGQALVSA